MKEGDIQFAPLNWYWQVVLSIPIELSDGEEFSYVSGGEELCGPVRLKGRDHKPGGEFVLLSWQRGEWVEIHEIQEEVGMT